MIFNCDAERDDTVCETHKCMCPHGCAGGDGKCYNGKKNIKIAGGFKLKNVKWPDQEIYMPSGFAATFESQLRTSTDDGSKFDLFLLPDETYLLASSEWPEYVVDMTKTELFELPLGQSGVTIPVTRWDVRAHRLGYWNGGLASVPLLLCNPGDPTHPEAVVFRNTANATIFIRFGSWKVYGYSLTSDPGEGGYWIPEPPLPVELPSCGYSSL